MRPAGLDIYRDHNPKTKILSKIIIGVLKMWVWSKGLGQTVMPLNLNEAEVTVDPEKIIMKGRITAPKVNWRYSVTLREQDLLDFMRILNDPQVVKYLVERGIIRRLPGLFGRVILLGMFFLRAEMRGLWSSSRRD